MSKDVEFLDYIARSVNDGDESAQNKLVEFLDMCENAEARKSHIAERAKDLINRLDGKTVFDGETVTLTADDFKTWLYASEETILSLEQLAAALALKAGEGVKVPTVRGVYS